MHKSCNEKKQMTTTTKAGEATSGKMLQLAGIKADAERFRRRWRGEIEATLSPTAWWLELFPDPVKWPVDVY